MLVKTANNSLWYRVIEVTCQLGGVGAFVYRAITVLPKQSPAVAEYVTLLPIPCLFLLLSLFFRRLSRVANEDPSPFISKILALIAALDITGIHLFIFIVALAILLSAMVTDSKELKDVTKYVVGLFSGMQFERRREKSSSRRSSHVATAS